jgi:hypothetical protein
MCSAFGEGCSLWNEVVGLVCYYVRFVGFWLAGKLHTLSIFPYAFARNQAIHSLYFISREVSLAWRMASSGMLRRVALVRRLLVTASVVPSSPILITLMKEALRSSETPVLTRATRRNIPEDTILHSHRRENLKSYMIWGPRSKQTKQASLTFIQQAKYMDRYRRS